jgi:hypothetical protein
MNQETQLKNILYEGGIFEVYFYAKNKIPKGSFVATDFNEIYGYNDYFSLMGIYREADCGGELIQKQMNQLNVILLMKNHSPLLLSNYKQIHSLDR